MRPLKWTRHEDLAIRRNGAIPREEYLDHMTFQRNVRPLFTEIFGPIVGLKEEWEEQGATPSELDFSAFRYRFGAFGSVPVNLGWLGGPAPQILEETERHRIYRDAMGRTMKLAKNVSTLALPMDWPVQSMDDWLKVKPYYRFCEERFAGDWVRIAMEHRAAGRVVTLGIPGGYDTPRQLMGDEEACIAFHEQPELIEDILKTIGDTICEALKRVVRAVPLDQLSVHEDMAGRSGPMIGPAMVRRFLVPYYRRAWELAREGGAVLFDQDSDGDLRPVLDAFLESGINCIHPVEPAAGMDPVRIRARYGTRLAFYGGIDKHVLRRSKDEIAAELEYKLPPLIETGGCVIALDHRIPNGTPLENYRFYVRKVWEIVERLTPGS